MSTLLEKYKALQKTKQAQMSSTKSTTVATPTAATRKPAPAVGKPKLSLSAGLRQSRLGEAATPKKKSSAQVLASMNATKAQAKQDTVQKLKESVEIPQTILDFAPELEQVDGLIVEDFKQTLADTYVALVTDEPMLPSLLQKIARNLNQYEELHYLLNADQIGLLFKGLMKTKNAFIKTTKQRASQKQIINRVEQEGGLDLLS